MRNSKLKPNALKNLGEDIFIRVPLYETKEKYIVKYVNDELFKEYYQDSDTSFEHMSDIIREEFSTTIDKDKSNGTQIGYAYVDMQEDPLKISLSGNLGSGRAYYQGDVFNIKGEKTPLVRSKRPEYSNGVLEYEKAMFETISSNSLYNDTNIKLSPILAILDINEPCQVYWKNKICKRAKIVRMDLDGSLNRITHIFKNKKELSSKEMLDIAVAFGKQEGEKFIQRIEHGAWSAGNISQYAHMIDFDTVSAVKYRAPQFSFCLWYIENYFGYEHLGQAKILKSLANSPEINIENVSYKDLKKTMINTRKDYLVNNFTKLMGIKSCDKKYLSDIKKLFKLFYKLSKKCYPIPEDLSCKNPKCYDCSPFDFSKFFRYYPILKRQENFNIFECFELLVNQLNNFDDFDINNFDLDDENNLFFFKHVLKKMDKDFIHNIDEFLKLSKECLLFIQMYDKLYEKLNKEGEINLAETERVAYKFNEDRKNLFMPYTLSGPIDDITDEISSYRVHTAISTAILSNKRNPEHRIFGLTPSDIKVFNGGFFAVLLNDEYKHKLSFNMYRDFVQSNEDDVFTIKINDTEFSCAIAYENDIISIQSDFIDNKNLLPGEYKTLEFYKNNSKISVMHRDVEFCNFAEYEV